MELSDSEDDFRGFTSQDIGDDVYDDVDVSSINSSSIEVSSISSGDIDLDDVDNFSNDRSDEDDTERERDFEEIPPLWKSDHFQDFLVFPFRGRNEGPNLPSNIDPSTSPPLEYLQLFFSDNLLSEIVKNTNSYAKYCIRQKRLLNPDYKDKLWSMDGANDLTLEELKAFLGVQIILGINPSKQYALAFSSNKYLCNIGIRECFSLKRFEKICQYLHVSDRDAEPRRPRVATPDYDWLVKVRPVVDKMGELFPKYCNFSEHSAIDESMIKTKCRVPWIIFNPSKPARRGIELFVRTDAKTGYVQQFEVYLGSKRTRIDKGLYFDVVSRLTQPLRGSYAKVYFDNAYNSISTLEFLLSHKIYACGTLRANRKYIPDMVRKPTKCVNGVTKKYSLKRGECFMYQDENNPNITCCIWQDVKEVRMASSFHKPHVMGTCTRRLRDGIVVVPTPQHALEYAKYYKGIDYFDQLMERYNVGRRTYRNWQYIFYWLFQTALVNSFILFKATSQSQRKKNYGQIDFRLQVAMGLIGNYSNRCLKPNLSTNPASVNRRMDFINHENTHMNVKRVRACRGHQRFENKSKRTIYGCLACGIFLCKSCHVKWHK